MFKKKFLFLVGISIFAFAKFASGEEDFSKLFNDNLKRSSPFQADDNTSDKSMSDEILNPKTSYDNFLPNDARSVREAIAPELNRIKEKLDSNSKKISEMESSQKDLEERLFKLERNLGDLKWDVSKVERSIPKEYDIKKVIQSYNRDSRSQGSYTPTTNVRQQTTYRTAPQTKTYKTVTPSYSQPSYPQQRVIYRSR